jgi:hypothetical protein
MDATLVSAIHIPGSRELVGMIYGDGAIFIKYKSGAVEAIYPTWAKNMPPYLSYHLHNHRKTSLCNAYHADGSAHGELVIDNTDNNGFKHPITIESGLEEAGLMFIFPLDSGIECISVVTDGIFQIGEHQATNVMRYLTDVKQYSGEFVKRTCMAKLKQAGKDGHYPIDDFAMASMHLEDPKDDEICV